jgi:hypothetical protein
MVAHARPSNVARSCSRVNMARAALPRSARSPKARALVYARLQSVHAHASGPAESRVRIYVAQVFSPASQAR